MSSELHGRNMRCYFERALCCLRHHAEVWLAYSRFEQAQPIDTDESAAGAHDNIKISKAILMEGIECNSHVAILRVALAELEEASGNTMAARETLRSAFRDIPSAFTFSVLQRHIRRLDGKLQARKFFSDTMSARLDGALNFEVLTEAIFSGKLLTDS